MADHISNFYFLQTDNASWSDLTLLEIIQKYRPPVICTTLLLLLFTTLVYHLCTASATLRNRRHAITILFANLALYLRFDSFLGASCHHLGYATCSLMSMCNTFAGFSIALLALLLLSFVWSYILLAWDHYNIITRIFNSKTFLHIFRRPMTGLFSLYRSLTITNAELRRSLDQVKLAHAEEIEGWVRYRDEYVIGVKAERLAWEAMREFYVEGRERYAWVVEGLEREVRELRRRPGEGEEGEGEMGGAEVEVGGGGADGAWLELEESDEEADAGKEGL